MEAANVSCGALNVEQACLLLKSEVDDDVYFQYQNMECQKCALSSATVIHPHGVEKLILDFVSFGTKWKVINKGNDTICRYHEQFFEEGAAYTLFINDTYCSVTQDSAGTASYLPLIVAAGVYFLLSLLYVAGKYTCRRNFWSRVIKSNNSLDELAASYSSNSCIEDNKPKQTKQRLRALDTVRGISVVVMIFVNYGGGKYWFFHHARWNGLTVADLVFPWFIWMMGMSIALSIRSLLRKSVPRKKIFCKILKRSFILFALGLMLNTLCLNVQLNHIRISGVLQRFSISYFIVATVHMFFAQAEDLHKDASFAPFRDILIYWGEWMIMISFLVAHILLTFLLHVPGCPVGYLGPGGLHDGGKFSLCTGGAAGYIDRLILGETHIYQHPSMKAIYHNTLPYDPEGILGYLTSIFLVHLGLQAGKILLTYQSYKSRLCRWLIWAVLTGVLAMLTCQMSKDDGWIPINKNLWSVSFIFATGSLAFILIALCYYVIDVKKWWTGIPFFYSGMNSILLYVGHEITHNVFPWSWKVANSHADQLAIDLWGTTLWVLISMWAYNIDFFVTL